MRYEWDERKNRSNQRKHDGVSFELATLVFEDPNCLVGLDRLDDDGEQRWHAIGAAEPMPGHRAILLVVHVHRENIDGEEIIRILSARAATKRELRSYEEQEME